MEVIRALPLPRSVYVADNKKRGREEDIKKKREEEWGPGILTQMNPMILGQNKKLKFDYLLLLGVAGQVKLEDHHEEVPRVQFSDR